MFIQQGHIKLTKSDSKDFYIKKTLLSIKESWKENVTDSTKKTLNSTTNHI